MSERLSYSSVETGSSQELASMINNFANCPAELQAAVCNQAINIMSRNASSSIRSNINY